MEVYILTVLGRTIGVFASYRDAEAYLDSRFRVSLDYAKPFASIVCWGVQSSPTLYAELTA